jgi:hypothetical protein
MTSQIGQKVIGKKDMVEKARSKSTCPKWHFGQVGQWPYGVFFDQNFW